MLLRKLNMRTHTHTQEMADKTAPATAPPAAAVAAGALITHPHTLSYSHPLTLSPSPWAPAVESVKLPQARSSAFKGSKWNDDTRTEGRSYVVAPLFKDSHTRDMAVGASILAGHQAGARSIVIYAYHMLMYAPL